MALFKAELWSQIDYRQRGSDVVGPVLDISKHEITCKKTSAGQLRTQARLYRFPSPAPLPCQATKTTVVSRNRFRFHLAIELAIGLVVWLLWFCWHVAH